MITEAQMEMDIYNKLKNSNIYKEVILEVPILNRCIDICMVTKNYEIITIECKLNNWRKAIEQSKDHKLCSDFSYICIPRKKVTEKILKELKEKGIGLFFYDDKEFPLTEIVSPRYNNPFFLYYESMKNKLNKIENKNIFKSDS